MKNEYLEKLKNTFSEKGIDENKYSDILKKYDQWYDTLLSENKSDDEIVEILKQPDEVVETFIAQFNVEEKTNEQKSTVVLEKEVIQEEVIDDFKPQPVQTVTEQQTNQAQAVNNPESSKQTNNANHQQNQASHDNIDTNLIVRTNTKGKEFYYRKRTFGGVVGMFFTFLIVSMFVLPLLIALFTSTLASSFVCMTVFFLPVYYIIFTFKNGTIAYIDEEALIRIQNEVFNTSGNTDIFGFTVSDANYLIAKINEFADFSFLYFLNTLLTSLFAFALAVLFLFASLQLMRIMLSYFIGFFHSMYYVRVK